LTHNTIPLISSVVDKARVQFRELPKCAFLVRECTSNRRVGFWRVKGVFPIAM
jgi:hypothetical protein